MPVKKVEVILPIVRLRIEDLAYLQGLQKEGMKCTIPHGKKDRLELLGLAQYEVLPPCPKEMHEWNTKQENALKAIKQELAKVKPDMDYIHRVSYFFGKPKERRQFVITKAGAQLLTKGKAMVQVKGECK